MNEGRRDDFGELPPTQARRVDAVCRRFEAEWRAGRDPRIEDSLAEVPEIERPVLLRELLALELELRCGRGEWPQLQEYRGRLPAHVTIVDAAFAAATLQQGTLSWGGHDRLGGAGEDARRAESWPAAIGRYRVVEWLGVGGQADVFRAIHPGLPGRDVVVKWARRALPAAYQRHLLDEARVLARLEDPGIVRVYDADVHEGRPFLVLEHVRGRSLRDQVRDQGTPRPRDAARLVAQLARTVSVLHQHHVLHLDLKPANVLIDAAGRPRLVDFGLATMPRIGDDTPARPEGTIAGSPGYMAPEQARGETRRLGPRTDLFGLGGVLYELLTGRPPYLAPTWEALLDQARRVEVIPPRRINRRIPRALERICIRALSGDPAVRYASADRLGRALRLYLWRRWIIAAPVLAGVLIATVAAVSLRDRNIPRPEVVTPAPALLDGDLILRVWSPDGGGKRGLKIDEAGALPVRNAEMVHLEARLDRPAFIYLLWFDSQGRPQPLYPWDPSRGFAGPLPREMPRLALHSPPELDRGWEVDGASGLETAVLLARRRPLSPEVDLAALVRTLPLVPYGDPRERQVWKVTPGLAAPRLVLAQHRGLKAAASKRLADPLVQLLERLRPHFDFIQAVRFAHEGG
jgi:serine/threonine protein kinase